MKKTDGEALQRVAETVSALRGENGCPWDQKQTHQSLRRYLLEESYESLEALDALDGSETSYTNLKEELGDLLLQILLHSELAKEKNAFTIADVADALHEKLVRRHPHVFGDEKVKDEKAVRENWEKLKNKEKKKDSILDSIPEALPALQRSEKIIEKVSKVGFQWPDLKGPLAKVEEELEELKVELKKAEALGFPQNDALPTELKNKIQSEIGDLLFCLSNVAYFLSINPEDSLREMLKRFEKRFRFVEQAVKKSGAEMGKIPLDKLDEYWNQAKQEERKKS